MVFWEVFHITTILLVFFWLPLKISFEIEEINELLKYEDSHKIFENILITILGLDVILGLNLAYINKGQIIKDRFSIFTHYLRKFGFVDLVNNIFIAIVDVSVYYILLI